MRANIKITKEDIVNEVKLSGKLPKIINQIIDRQIIATTVSKLKIDATDRELQASADRFRLLNHLESVQATTIWLQEHSLSVENLEQIAEHTVNISKLSEKLFNPDRVEQHFIENQLNYTGAVMYEMILDSQDLAREIFDAIQKNEMTFHQAATQYITDPELRRCGGYIGIRSREQLLPEVSAAVFAQRTPRLLQPLTTSQGTHLIYVEEIIEPKLAACFEEIVDRLFSQWLQSQRSEVDIIKVAI